MDYTKSRRDAAQRICGMKAGGKVAKVMREYKAGQLRSGSKNGPIVKDRKQALAIAINSARRER